MRYVMKCDSRDAMFAKLEVPEQQVTKEKPPPFVKCAFEWDLSMASCGFVKQPVHLPKYVSLLGPNCVE